MWDAEVRVRFGLARSASSRADRRFAYPFTGRIVAVADVFDARTSDRVYHPAMSVPEALAMLRAGVGTHFDPEVVTAFDEAFATAPLSRTCVRACPPRPRPRPPRCLAV